MIDSGTASGVMTAILLVVFIGIIAWAYSGKRRRDFEEAAQLPFDDDAPGADNDDSKGNAS